MRGFTVLVAATIVSLAACRTIETKVPPVELPEASVRVFRASNAGGRSSTIRSSNALIDEAFAANLDLGVAIGAHRGGERQPWRSLRSSLFPSGRCLRRMPIARDAAMRRRIAFPGPMATNTSARDCRRPTRSTCRDAFRPVSNAALSTLLATRYNAEAVRTVLAAQVATTYFTLLALDAELQISRDTLVTREEASKLQRCATTPG